MVGSPYQRANQEEKEEDNENQTAKMGKKIIVYFGYSLEIPMGLRQASMYLSRGRVVLK